MNKTTPLTGTFEIDAKLPSKKNSYQIFFSRSFWSQVSPIVRALKRSTGRSLYWISPSQETKDFERFIAWTAIAAKIPQFGDAEVELNVKVNTRLDLDNVLGALLDGLEASEKIRNDRQVSKITIERWKKKKLSVTISRLIA